MRNPRGSRDVRKDIVAFIAPHFVRLRSTSPASVTIDNEEVKVTCETLECESFGQPFRCCSITHFVSASFPFRRVLRDAVAVRFVKFKLWCPLTVPVEISEPETLECESFSQSFRFCSLTHFVSASFPFRRVLRVAVAVRFVKFKLWCPLTGTLHPCCFPIRRVLHG